MSGGSTIRAAVIVVLLLPGLAVAGPIPGSCARCGDGDACHLRQTFDEEPDPHSCCESAADETSTNSSLDTSACECGRETPPAITAGSSSAIDFGSALTPIREAVSPVSSGDSYHEHSVRPPAPPPAPPAYLIDCAFLT